MTIRKRQRKTNSCPYKQSRVNRGAVESELAFPQIFLLFPAGKPNKQKMGNACIHVRGIMEGYQTVMHAFTEVPGSP